MGNGKSKRVREDDLIPPFKRLHISSSSEESKSVNNPNLPNGEYLYISQHPHEFIDKAKQYVLDCKDVDPKFKNAMIENYKLIEQASQYIAKRLWSSSPCIDLNLDPSEVYTVYKIACFHNDSAIVTDVAVLVTLTIQSSKAFIADGATGKKILPENMTPNTKYCTKTAIVTGLQFIGNVLSIEKILEMYKNGEGKIVSNFDSKFEYRLSNEITEPEFGQPGLGCVKGIHFFIDKRSALKYTTTGFIDLETTLTPVIAAKFTESRISDDIKDIELPRRSSRLNPPPITNNMLQQDTIEKMREIIENLYKTTKTTDIHINSWNNRTLTVS